MDTNGTNDPGRLNANVRNPRKGLRILAVEDNETDLETLRTALLSLDYKVTTCRNRDEAMTLFQEGGLVIDAVLANIDWQIGFEFVEYVGLKMDLPIIVICPVEDKKLIAEAINRGAYFGLVKPLGAYKLDRIWQFVLAHRRCSLIGNQEPVGREAADQSSGNEGGTRGRKRREREIDEVIQPSSGGILVRQSHLVWTDELNRRFVEIVQRLGKKMATPKRIQELMNEPFLTRKNVASRLQKYLLALKKTEDTAATASANAKREVVIDEPVPVNVKDIAERLAQYSTPNVTSLPTSSRFMFGNMSSQPYYRGTDISAEGMRWIASQGCGSNRHAQLSIRPSCPSNELTRCTFSITPSVMDRDIGLTNRAVERRLPLEPPSGYFLGDRYYGAVKLEMGSRDISYDQKISSILRGRQMTHNEQMLGVTQQNGGLSRGFGNVQNGRTEEQVGNGALNVAESLEDSAAMMPTRAADTDNPAMIDGKEGKGQGTSAEQNWFGYNNGFGQGPSDNHGGM